MDCREQMNFLQWNMSEVHVVRLVLGRHQDQEDSVNELHASESVDPHVHQDPVQDRHGDVEQDGSKFDRESSQEEDTDPCDSLFSDSFKLRNLSWSRGLGVHLEAVHVAQTEDGGSYTPGEAKQRTDPNHDTTHQHVKMVSTTFLQNSNVYIPSLFVLNLL